MPTTRIGSPGNCLGYSMALLPKHRLPRRQVLAGLCTVSFRILVIDDAANEQGRQFLLLVRPWSAGHWRQRKTLEMKKLYVGNLSFSATEDKLRSLFERYGIVERSVSSRIVTRDSQGALDLSS